MKKLPFPLLLFSVVLVVLGVITLGLMTGFIPVRDIFASFITFVFTLVIITVLAIIGAVFLGMFISHRVFSTRQFTAFEEEMLKMKEDIEYIKEKVEEMEED